MYAIRSYYDIYTQKYELKKSGIILKPVNVYFAVFRDSFQNELQVISSLLRKWKNEKDSIFRITSYNVCYTKLLRG